jgi:hypothetical protein
LFNKQTDFLKKNIFSDLGQFFLQDKQDKQDNANSERVTSRKLLKSNKTKQDKTVFDFCLKDKIRQNNGLQDKIFNDKTKNNSYNQSLK